MVYLYVLPASKSFFEQIKISSKFKSIKLVLCVALILQPIPIFCAPTRFSSIIDSIDYFIFDKVLKACLITRKDVAKECTKLILPFVIPAHIPYARLCTGYGCEAGWTCYFDGAHAIPGALFRYTCVNTCYDQLCKGAQAFNLEYPQQIKNNAKLYALSGVIVPMVAKHGLGIIIKALFNAWWHDEPESEENYLDS